jgi:hypothetical protein
MKMMLLKIAAASAGITLAVCLFAATGLWYVNRPKPSKPWNEKALVINGPPGFGTSEKEFPFYLSYSVKNTTDKDYSVESAEQIRMMAELNDGSLSNPLETRTALLRTPVFIPANQLGTITIRLKIKIPEQKQNETDDDYHERIRKFVNETLPNLRGFALFDNTNRYRINLPEWMRIKPDKTGDANGRSPA